MDLKHIAPEAYDPSQVQAYDQSTQAYYDYHLQYQQQYNQQQQQQYPYYPQDYANAYRQPPQQAPTSIHPPGVPVPPEPAHFVGQEQGFHQAHVQSQQVPYYRPPQLDPAAAVAQFPGNAGYDQGQQWQGTRGGSFRWEDSASSAEVEVPSSKIGQYPPWGGGRAGRPLRGGRGRGRGRGRGGHLPSNSATATAEGPVSLGQGQSIPTWPPRIAWCELCRVDCNTVEILEQHKNGKRHKKNLQVHAELQNLNKLLVEGQNEQMPNPELKTESPNQAEKVGVSGEKGVPLANLTSRPVTQEIKKESELHEVSEAAVPEGEQAKKPRMDHFEARGRGSKRKMRGGRGGKWMKTSEGSRRSVEPSKPKEIVPLICELCNVKCESPIVFDSHLKGKKHLSNLKKFEANQAMLGQAALQALYPALQALLYPALQALCQADSNAPQFHQQGVQGPQDHYSQPGSAMFPQGKASTSAPPFGTLDQQDSKLQFSTPGGLSLTAVTEETKDHQQATVVDFETKKATSADVSSTVGADQASFGTVTGGSVDIPESENAPSNVLPLAKSVPEEPESKGTEPTETSIVGIGKIALASTKNVKHNRIIKVYVKHSEPMVIFDSQAGSSTVVSKSVQPYDRISKAKNTIDEDCSDGSVTSKDSRSTTRSSLIPQDVMTLVINSYRFDASSTDMQEN
ncbi:hypothetical protein RJ640_017489 [Escallonia rubra]|uniref:U1-type domain-containing protein n=1 Tax=Escallonia rubra TaxID=112253 RepID=A0AA88R9K3_9ASTE|nr:hypothetical protein RJ640_017489 [Escallonia rubra]